MGWLAALGFFAGGDACDVLQIVGSGGHKTLTVVSGDQVAAEPEVETRIRLFKIFEWFVLHKLRLILRQLFHRDTQIMMMPDMVAVVVHIPAGKTPRANAP